jgi:C4-dicarboxylate-specific signal transduction histidine kinase
MPSLQEIAAFLAFIAPAAGAVWLLIRERTTQRLKAEIEAQNKRLELELEESRQRLEERNKRLEAELEKARQQLGAEIDAQADHREHVQKQSDLETAYHLAEGAAAQQVMAELVANSQDKLDDAYGFIRSDIKADLEQLQTLVDEIQKQLLSYYPKIDEVPSIKYELRNFSTQSRLLVNLIREIYEKLFKEQSDEKLD